MKSKIASTTFIVLLLTFCGCKSVQTENQTHPEKTKHVLQEGTLEIDGFALKYIRRGTGEPIIVIGSADYYSKAFSNLNNS